MDPPPGLKLAQGAFQASLPLPFPLYGSLEPGDPAFVQGKQDVDFATTKAVRLFVGDFSFTKAVGEIVSLRPVRRYVVRVDDARKVERVSPNFAAKGKFGQPRVTQIVAGDGRLFCLTDNGTDPQPENLWTTTKAFAPDPKPA